MAKGGFAGADFMFVGTVTRFGGGTKSIGLGARRYPWRYQPGADYVVLEDPDRNLFCVVQTPPTTRNS